MIERESRIERLVFKGQFERFVVRTPVIDPRMECQIPDFEAASQPESTDANVAIVDA